MSSIHDLLNDLISNPESISNIGEEKVLELRQKLNPYGCVVSNEPSVINISIVNWREKYLRRLTMTSLLGYLYRCLDGHEQYDDVSPNHPKLAGIDDGAVREPIKQKLIRDANETFRENVRKFLNRHFEYNVDNHVRKATDENLSDPERMKHAEARIRAMQTASSAEAHEAFLKASAEEADADLTDRTRRVYETARSATDVLTDAIRSCADGNLDRADLMGVLSRKREELNACLEGRFGDAARAFQARDTKSVLSTNPPADVFYHWERYHNNNFEALNDAVNHLYADKPDIEYAVQYYDHYEGENRNAAAAEFCRKHESDFIHEVLTLENGSWSIVGPYRKNRERISFYNKNTEVIKRMLEQLEMDQRLGEDIMKKRVKREKGKNIAVAGPDDPGLQKYKAAATTVETLSAKDTLTDDERAQLRDAQRFKEMTEVPENAIQVDYFSSNPKTGDFQRNFFYTRAEAPDPSANDELLPNRQKTIKSRDGKTAKTSDLKK